MITLRQLKWNVKSLRIRRYCISANRLRDVRTIEHSLPDRTIQTPELATNVLALGAKHLARRERQVPPIRSIIAKDFLVNADDGIVMNGARRVLKEMLSCPQSIDPIRRSVANPLVERLEGVYGIFRSESASYYHSLIDNIPRSYLMHHPQCRDLGPMEIFYAGRLNPIEAYLLPKLLPDTVTPRRFEKDRLYQPETLFIPGFLSGRFAGHLPDVFTEFLWDRVCPHRPPKREHRILISRKPIRGQSKGREILNEDELMAGLEPLGFKRRSPEELSIEEQIELFYDSDYVIAPHGAGLANIVFSKATRVLELFASNEIVPHYYFLSKSLGHQYAFWKGDADHRNAAFRVNVPEVVELVKRSLASR